MDTNLFNKNRIRFAYTKNRLIVIESDVRDTDDILKDDYNIPYEEVKNCIRGYYYKNKLYIYLSHTYMPVPINQFPKNLFDFLKLLIEKNTNKKTEIYNGLIIGEHCSFWKPVYRLAIYNDHDISLESISN